MTQTVQPIPQGINSNTTLVQGPHLDGFAQFSFASNHIAHPVYYAGEHSYPPLLLMSELAGFSPGMLMFAERLIAAQFQVYVPWLFGPFRQRAPLRNAIKLCISREFANLRAGISAPITSWLRALTAHISQHNGDVKVGAIGMCLTGAFAIPLIIDPQVVAAVAAQPSVPLSLLHIAGDISSGSAMRALNISDADIAQARTRLVSGSAQLFACRFHADRICPAAKLERLRQEFPIGLETHEYADHTWRNTLGNRPHATFTKEYRIAPRTIDQPAHQAFTDLITFFNRHLKTLPK